MQNNIGYWQLIKRNRNFRLLWLGEIVSLMGDWFNVVAIFALLLELTGSAKSASWVIIIRTLPYFFMGPIAGVVVDRFNRKTIMLLSDLLRCIVVLALLFVKAKSQIWIIYSTVSLEIILSTFFTPAKNAVIPNVVSKEELISANALSSVTWSAMLTLGAMVGGVVSAIFGRDVAFIANSISYLFSALMILRVTIPETQRSEHSLSHPPRHPLHQFMDGLNYMKKKRDILAYLFIKAGWGLSGGIILLITIYGERIYPIKGNPDAGIALLYTVRGLGTACGPIVGRKVCGQSQEQMRKWVGYSFLIGGLFFLWFGFVHNVWLACLALFLSHVGTSILWVFSTTLLQMNSKDEYRGRVFAMDFSIFTLLMSLSNYLTGSGLDQQLFTPQGMMYILAFTLFVPGIIWLILESRWNQWIKDS